MDKTAFMVCSTYRSPDKSSPLRLFGLLNLVEEMKTSSWKGGIYLSIVDSSPEPHPFFKNPEGFIEHGILYLHIPDRNGDEGWRKKYPDASRFIPTNQDLKTSVWQDRYNRLKAWDTFCFFTEEFRKIYNGPKPSDFLHFDRPAIGMKKNLGIAVCAEIFGSADAIIFCDDDDIRHADYISFVMKNLEQADFARMRQWMTLRIDPGGKKEPVWGIYDIPFEKDINDMWHVPVAYRDRMFRSSLENADGTMFQRTIGSKFSVPLCMGWPPLGHEGALHNYRYKTWEKAVEAFGGCAPTSFCEDMLMYKQCEQKLDLFDVKRIDTEFPLFIRCTDGSNASEVEWTVDLPADHPHGWAHQANQRIQAAFSKRNWDLELTQAGEIFLKSGAIDWNRIFPQRAANKGMNPPQPL